MAKFGLKIGLVKWRFGHNVYSTLAVKKSISSGGSDFNLALTHSNCTQDR